MTMDDNSTVEVGSLVYPRLFTGIYSAVLHPRWLMQDFLHQQYNMHLQTCLMHVNGCTLLQKGWFFYVFFFC